MKPRNADYAGDQPQDVGPEQDEKIEKRRNRPIRFNKVGRNRVAMNWLGEGGRPMFDPVRPVSHREDP